MRNQFSRYVILAIALALFVAVALRFARRSPRTRHDDVLEERVAAAASTPSASGTSSLAPAPQSASTSTASLAPASAPRVAPTVTRSSSTVAPVPPAPNDPAMGEIDQVNLMIRDYRTLAGENPVGTNAEIMSVLMGNNPKHAKLGPPEGAELNEKGELIDRWGTPYFFHQLSRDHMEIRSAGPDKVMWTADDPVIK